MKWVVGTGRCGIHNYTALNNGWVQSRKDWKITALNKYHGKPYDKNGVDCVISERMNLPYGCVSDCAQFMFLDEIKRLDRNAEFVWLIRDKESCVDSFMKKGGEENRIHPLGWDFNYENKRKLLSWYYDEVNRIIGNGLAGTSFEKINTEDMPLAKEEDIVGLRAFA